MKVFRRMPKSTNMRIDYLDEMTITSITANTFDSHSDAGSISSTSRQSSSVSMADSLQEVKEIIRSNKAPLSHEDLLQYTDHGRILPKLHGFPYISIVNATNMSRRTSTVTLSPTASTHTTNSSIQTEGAFSVRRLSSTFSSASRSSDVGANIDIGRSHSATSRGQGQVIRARTPSFSATSRPSSISSEDTSPPTCGCRALITALRRSLTHQRPSRINPSTIYPQSSGQHPKLQQPPQPPGPPTSQTHHTLNEFRLTALDQAWATMGMPDFFTWLLSEFRFIKPSPGAMDWPNRVELGDTSKFHWRHWEDRVEKFVAGLKEEDVWMEGDEFGDVVESVIATLQAWLRA